MVLEELIQFVMDTNIVLYLLGDRLVDPMPKGHYSVSVVTEMEILSYPNLADAEEQQIRDLLSKLEVIGLTDTVKERAIDLRKQHNLKLPDAIIAATALASDAVLMTNDTQLLKLAQPKAQAVRLMS
ncbi:MAG: type II toxin-antitoxin system VapC family toxin [Cyanobacteria bacterium P01_D01_bin.115]